MANPNPPKWNWSRLSEFGEALLADGDFMNFVIDYAYIIKRTGSKRDELSLPAAAFETILLLSKHIDNGNAKEQWDVLMDEHDDFIKVPIRYVMAIAEGWEKFKEEKSFDLFEAMKLDNTPLGQRQGTDWRAAIRKDYEDFAIAQLFEWCRSTWAASGEEISLPNARTKLADFLDEIDFWEKSGIERPKKDVVGRIKRAYRSRGGDVREINETIGMPIIPPE